MGNLFNLKMKKMKKDYLMISVSGETNSGKSRLSLLLKKFLRENGFKVEFDGGIDYEGESQFNEAVSKNFEEAIESIKEKKTIILKEHQLGNIQIA